jgi:hypothetical protein
MTPLTRIVEKKSEGGHLGSHCFEIQYVVIRS